MMAMDKSRYPSNWDAISHRIRYERAGGKCEWCGAPDRAHIKRLKANPAQWEVTTADFPGDATWYRASRVVLTVHHIGIPHEDGTPGDPHDKMDVREANLAALCNRCHLYADLPIHIENARKTRLRKKREAAQSAGQLELFEGEA